MSSFCLTLHKGPSYPLESVEMNCTDCKDGRLFYNPGETSFLLSRVSRAIVLTS